MTEKWQDYRRPASQPHCPDAHRHQYLSRVESALRTYLTITHLTITHRRSDSQHRITVTTCVLTESHRERDRIFFRYSPSSPPTNISLRNGPVGHNLEVYRNRIQARRGGVQHCEQSTETSASRFATRSPADALEYVCCYNVSDSKRMFRSN